MLALCKILAALCLLAFSGHTVEARHKRYFGITVHLPVKGNCEAADELQSKTLQGKYVGDDDGRRCRNFPAFHAFYYKYSPVRHYGESPYRYGICPVTVYNKKDCTGEKVLHFPDGNNRAFMDMCYAYEFRKMAGRSVMVGPCTLDGHRPPGMPHPDKKGDLKDEPRPDEPEILPPPSPAPTGPVTRM